MCLTVWKSEINNIIFVETNGKMKNLMNDLLSKFPNAKDAFGIEKCCLDKKGKLIIKSSEIIPSEIIEYLITLS